MIPEFIKEIAGNYLTGASHEVQSVGESGRKWILVGESARVARHSNQRIITDKGMFRGLHEHTIDAKGRTSVPARFRDVLTRQTDLAGAEQLIITTGIDPCLVAYTPKAWAAFEAKLATLSQFDPAVVQLKRIYVAGATECDIDGHGRLLIPPPLRTYAGLEKEVVWAGMVTTLEIWAKEAWDVRMAACREDRAGLARAMTELGL